MGNILQNRNMDKIVENLILIICCIGFLLQTISQIIELADSTSTDESNLELREMIPFPLIFNIVVKPGYKRSMLNFYGYDDELDYLLGKSRHNSSVLGWGGHNEKGEPIEDPKGISSKFLNP